MNLKDANSPKKLAKFIAEMSKTHPKASHAHFHGVVKSMAAGTAKPKRGTSSRASRAD
jgi:hypothetical protein